MTTFHLIRHAEVAVVGRVLVGRTDLRLTDQGREHAEQLGARLGGAPIDRILSSPRQRARETAEALARHAGQPLEIAAEIDEVDFGAWTGKTVDELEPDPLWQQFNGFRIGLRIPGGERLLDVQTRVVEFMLRLHQVDRDQVVALVSHREPIQIAVGYFVGAPLELFDRFEISPCSVTTVTLGPSGPIVVGLNRSSTC